MKQNISKDIKYMTIIFGTIIIFIIIYFVYRHFKSEQFPQLNNLVIEKYNEIMNSLLDKENLNLNEIISAEQNYVEQTEEDRKNYEIAKTIYNQKLVNLSKIVEEISEQNIILKTKTSDLQEKFSELDKKVSAGTESSEVIDYIKTDVQTSYKKVLDEIESRKLYFQGIQDKISEVKKFIENFNELIINYKKTLNFGGELFSKIENAASEFTEVKKELKQLKDSINDVVKDKTILESMNQEIDGLLEKMDSVGTRVKKQSDIALRELEPDREIGKYEKLIIDFNNITKDNKELLDQISSFLENFQEKLKTIDNTHVLFDNISTLDKNVKDLKDLIDELNKL